MLLEIMLKACKKNQTNKKQKTLQRLGKLQSHVIILRQSVITNYHR